jgi:predicted transcriptional regulator
VKRFSEGIVTDEERSRRPSTSRTEENIAKVCQIVRENRRLTIRSIAEQVNIDRETVRKILTEDLDMLEYAKVVPMEPTEEQSRVTICQDLLDWQGGILGRVMTGDEHGSTNTILKRSRKVHTGILPIPNDKKKISQFK